MPWRKRTVEESRGEFVKRAITKEKSKSALCREYGISRPTGDKWIARYIAGEGLSDRSRRPFHTPNRIAPEMEDVIVAARKREPALGAWKTKRMLLNAGMEGLPGISTINEIFRRNGLITRQASERATPYKRFEKEAPNIMWQADFKGDFLMGNGKRCYPLSVMDDHSRFCLCGDAKANMRLGGVVESFTSTFRQFGLPESLLCDNGVPWGSSQTTSITRFEVWLMDLGVLTIHIRARHPQTQGKVERFNGAFKQERLAFYTPKDLTDANNCRKEYQRFYNELRPHHALNLDVPKQHYTPGTREFPTVVQPWEYEADAIVRNVKSTGYLTYRGQGYYLSEGLGDKTVALIPSDRDGVFDVVYRQFRVARLSLHDRVISSRRVYLRHNDPRLKV